MNEKAQFNAPVVTDDRAEEPEAPGYVPEGYETVDEYLEDMREDFKLDLEFDDDNRTEAIEDLEFLAKDQWDPDIRAAREDAGKPCMTINVLPQFIGQVIGDRRLNKTSINVRPLLDATMKEAEARAGIIKGVEANSRAERVYDATAEDQISCGIGNMRVHLDYADDDAFLQDIFIKQIPNPLSVIWDRMSVDPTGSDARHCFVEDKIPKREFEKMYPDANQTNSLTDEYMRNLGSLWFDEGMVRVVEHWRMLKRPATIAMFGDGSIREIQPEQIEELVAQQAVVVDPRTGQPVMRETRKTFAQMHLVNGWEILSGPYELPCPRLPIVKATGREVRVGDERIRFGLIRHAKDSCRMKNFWRSIAVEKLAMAPQNVWTAEANSVEGREDEWRNAHLSGDPVLVYNTGTQRPKREDPPPLDAAILQEVQMNAQDIKDVTGLHDASLGIRSNEVSGKAIMARQHEGDVATVTYHDNLNAAIQEVGVVVNSLIPIAYDTVRTLRVVGADEKEELKTFNNPSDPESIDLGKGKYDVSVTTGPSYTTQRMFAAEAMLEAVKVFPQLMEIAGDLVVTAQDWPGAHEIAERLKKIVPEEIRGKDDEDLSPEEAQQAAQQQAAQQQAAQQQQQMQQQAAQLALAKEEAEVLKAQAEARQAEADADKAEADADKAEIEAEHAAATKAAEVLRLDEPEQPERSEPQQRSGAPRRGAGSQPKKGKRNAQPRKK